jgi:glycosyltransferase involved in cell wall biosynthesis
MEEPISDVKVRDIYQLGPKYFVISNQFWTHKDHATSFKAFARIARLRSDVTLVCTGETRDPRDVGHFPRLMQLLDELRIRERVKVLGVVPKSHQLGLLRHSIAVIQPTLSEGGPGGGSVYDAVALGVRSVVSDIDVNRELSDRTVSFFRAGDADDLANAMNRLMGEPHIPITESLLRAASVARRTACGRVLMNALIYAVNHARR